MPLLGQRIPAETLRLFWTMPAHHQSGLLNAAEFARALGVDGRTFVWCAGGANPIGRPVAYPGAERVPLKHDIEAICWR